MITSAMAASTTTTSSTLRSTLAARVCCAISSSRFKPSKSAANPNQRNIIRFEPDVPRRTSLVVRPVKPLQSPNRCGLRLSGPDRNILSILSFRGERSRLWIAMSGSRSVDESDQSQSSQSKTVRVVVKGRVQGVFYRDWTTENAQQLGLNGWVRNRRDGSVEALFSGEPDKVKEMEQRCRSGPPAAMVTRLDVFPSDEDPGSGFERRQTA